MKKEINALIASSDATLTISPVCTLARWTKVPYQTEEVDVLEAQLHFMEKPYDKTVTIVSRSWEGVIAEAREAQRQFLSEISEKLTSDLDNGYLY